MINGHQCRAGRALLRWRREDLAEKTNISVVSIKHFEDEHHQTRTTTIAKISKVMEDAGIEFLPNSGLRLRDDTLTVIEGEDSFLRLMDDIYYTLNGIGGELLWSFVDDSVSPPEVWAMEAKIREAGITMRSLVSEDAKIFPYPLEEYRCVPRDMFDENPIAIYDNKVAIFVKGVTKNVCIVNNKNYASSQRAMFNISWKYCGQPKL